MGLFKRKNGEQVNRPEIIFSLCHTTARLPDGWRAAAQAWLDNCDHPERVEHVLTMDAQDVAIGFVAAIENPVFPNTQIGINHEVRTAVAGWNLAAKLSMGKFIISLADDWFPCPHWDTALLEVIEAQENGLDGEYVLDVDTTGNHHLLTFSLLTRAYLMKYSKGEGWLFYPEYTGMYADNDFSDSAKLIDQVVVDARHLVFPHRHPNYTPGVEADEIHKWQGRPEAYRIGIKVYKKRCAGKGIKIRPRLALAFPGTQFSSVWVVYWTNLVNELSKHFDLNPINAFCSNVHVTRMSITQQIVQAIPMADYVLWLDDDNLLSVQNAVQLINDLALHPEAAAVFGWSWVQPDLYDGGQAITSVGRFEDGDRVGHMVPYPELMAGDEDVKEIGFSGFPAVVMRGEMLEALGEGAFAPLMDPAQAWGFASEDKAFCMRARDAGYRIFVDRRVRLPHLKMRDAEPREIPAIAHKAVPVVEEVLEVAAVVA